MFRFGPSSNFYPCMYASRFARQDPARRSSRRGQERIRDIGKIDGRSGARKPADAPMVRCEARLRNGNSGGQQANRRRRCTIGGRWLKTSRTVSHRTALTRCKAMSRCRHDVLVL